jgi:hypothetical protein
MESTALRLGLGMRVIHTSVNGAATPPACLGLGRHAVLGTIRRPILRFGVVSTL